MEVERNWPFKLSNRHFSIVLINNLVVSHVLVSQFCSSFARENTNHWKIKNINATEQRIGGLCPLTPKEVRIFLQALGYPTSTLIYVAAGEIYGANTHLSELTSHFPNVVFKVC